MADAYTVLARRYRSQNFDELVGQEAIAQTLKNAIKSNRVAHAFLFTGTRGVGKTSAARILAKAVNCPNRAPDGNPCGTCETCKAIARGEDIDVIEIDGASNNSVDQIRELRQSAGIRPAKSPYKIYIIDEVHMLSTGAFNALLKTLEEPPEHVKFIFATTDIHKVPATIISRCQRFDFKNIATPRIADHLTQVIKDEGIKADKDAVYRIARLGNGSMRDALSILDRVLSLGEKHVTDKILEDLLGRPPTAAIAQLVAALANADAAAAITHADALLKEGMGVEQVLSELIEFLRNLMIVAACGDKTDLLDVPTEARAAYTDLSGKFDAPTLVHLIALCEQTLRSLKASTMHRPLFDALIVRLALSEQFSSIKQLLSNDQSQSIAQPADKKKSDVAPGGSGADALVGRSESDGTSHNQANSSPTPKSASPSQPPPPTADALDASAADQPEENIYDQMKQHIRRKQEELEASNAQLRQQRGATSNGHGRPGAPGQSPAPAPPLAQVEKVADLKDLTRVWTAARAYLLANARILETVLGNCTHLRSLTTEPPEALLEISRTQERFTNDKARGKLEEALRAVTGLTLKLRVEFVEPPAGNPATGEGYSIGVNIPPTPSQTAQRVPPEVIDAVKKQPIVQELMKRLDATVTQVEMLGTGEEEP